MRLILAGAMVLALIYMKGASAQSTDGTPGEYKGNVYGKMRSTTPSQRQSAAENARKKGLQIGVAGAKANLANSGAVPPPSGTPDYFGPYSNYANSPLPGGTIASIALTTGGTSYTNPTVTITDLYGIGTGASTATASVLNGVITGITGGTGGSGYVAPIVTITDSGAGTGATASARIGPPYTGGMHKFIDALPSLTVASGTPCTYSGQAADCYEIWAVEYRQQMHSDLTPVSGTYPNQTGGTQLRGYVEVIGGNPVGTPSYLGPVIVAQRDKPVRITFRNKLPYGPVNPTTGRRPGDLFIPVDTSYMGAGAVPAGSGYNPGETYTQNRLAVHLHGATTPWISDGTVYQWITPANETTSYPTGVSVQNVPDMPNPGAGALTFYYTNQQSARLMFYHDHAAGITRLNVYAGVAAGYLVTDANATRDPITPVYGVGTPLVIQDKTFVWGTPPVVNPGTGAVTTPGTGTWATDPTWDSTKWGSDGNLWFPHVYMTNQNPYDSSGANAMGRWDYGPWFWPPFTGLIHGPIANPYFDCGVGGPCTAPWEPPLIPGFPSLSGTPESFMDTPTVNGKAYPTLNVPAGPVRFRILSVGNDRMQNLSLWVAADKTSPTTPGIAGTVLCTNNAVVPPANCTEVKMVPFNSVQNAAAPFPSWWATSPYPWTFDDRAGGVPDPATRGPAMIQIATEGGFLPAPVVIKNQPVNYVYNRRDITVGNVLEHALLLGPAERADVLVDFTNFAGKTLILYNDSPAPVPASDPRLDYYTGAPNQADTGGSPEILPGYGPNTRTVMQIVVAGTSAGSVIPVDDVNATMLSQLQAALPAAFKAAEETIIVPQAAYNTVYGTSVVDAPNTNLSTIQDSQLIFNPLTSAGTLQSTPATFEFHPKAIIEDFQIDYGRMNALIGVEIPRTNNTNQTSIIQNLADPPTEVVKISDPALSPIGTTSDGTQLWKITHNGVDTHAMHFHMFTVQIVNRVGWDGAIRPPDPNELGFKDTVRMNPLEDIIVATRPIKLTLPFKVGNSLRLLAPEAPPGATVGPTGMPLFADVDPSGTPVTITNQTVNYGWEYVWHCHILGHEENDMMRPMALANPPESPSNLVVTKNLSGNAVLNWVNNSYTASEFTIQRAGNSAFTGGIVSNTISSSSTTYTDTTVVSGQRYYYRVYASNTVGSTVPGYPQVTADSGFSNPAVFSSNLAPNAAAVTVWRPSTGIWYSRPFVFAGSYTGIQWGLTSDIPIAADYDGDTILDYAVFRPSTFTWFIIPSSSPSTFISTAWGTTGDMPVAADYDGDGFADVAVYRPSNGTWYVLPSSSPGTYTTHQWGLTGDVPVPMDYDADGKADMAVYHPSTGVWYILTSGTPGNYWAISWGLTTDMPVPGDYDGDGKADVAVWRPGTGVWYILLSGTPGSYRATQWGVTTDYPVPGDFDADGKVDIAVWRPASGNWYILTSGTPGNYAVIPWGLTTDIPISKITRIVGLYK
jgi:FtsP/CotA-like multicopper oxidase with cupredoxin domain